MSQESFLCLTICPAFDSVHSWLMKSFIIKKPNQTTPQFGNLWLDSPGRADHRESLQSHTFLIYCCFCPEFLQRVRASHHRKRTSKDLALCRDITPQLVQGLRLCGCAEHRIGAQPVLPNTHSQEQGTAPSDLYFHTWQLSTWKNSPSGGSPALQHPQAEVSNPFLTASSFDCNLTLKKQCLFSWRQSLVYILECKVSKLKIHKRMWLD